MHLSTNNKLQVIKELKKNNISISSVSRKYGVSRKTIYKWLSIYKQAKTRNKKTCLDLKYKKAKNHPKYYRGNLKSKLIRIITTNPEFGVTKLTEILKNSKTNKILTIPGRHAIYSLLQELNLTNRIDRENFARLYKGPGRLHLDIKGEVVREILQEKKSISDVSQKRHLSRKTIYKWIKIYQSHGSVLENYVSGFHHPKAYSEDLTVKVLTAVVKNPELSIHKLAKHLSLGSHGVWNVLKKNNLTQQRFRLLYALDHRHVSTGFHPILDKDRVKSVWEKFTPNLAPAPPPDETNFKKSPKLSILLLLKFFINIAKKTLIEYIKLPFKQKNPLNAFLIALSFPFTVYIVSLGLINFLSIYTNSPSLGLSIGYLFATGALGCGFLFFIYSIKYYISVVMILLYSRKSLVKKDGDVMQVSYQKNNGLLADVSNVILDRKPFVSIHVATYNEKRVINRLIEAVTSQDYDNYEVIICDDSTDETKDIVMEWKNHPRVKILHRNNRIGYKGAALAGAVKIMDPRTEFVCVYDADFLPYPDSITQFLKYFKNTVGSLNPKDYVKSNIAVVQGYQWHVLNKSENWITKGVRTEYAGSYVIERSNIENYGGLKQIAGSVYLMRADVLRKYSWGTSITEDFELTLKLYRDGYKVVYTPYVQAPSECVSTLKRLIRQRMRWAEGHSYNIKKMFMSMMSSQGLTYTEKIEFLYLSPYYLQSAFFIFGTLAWFISEVVFRVKLPFWTAVWGWSLVLTNMLSLPLMNIVGLFLEEAEDKDYSGIPSFVFLSYILAPFQAYAAIKGFLEDKEGPWFRTPKTGRITDTYKKGRFFKWLSGIFGKPEPILNENLIVFKKYQKNSQDLQYCQIESTKNRKYKRWTGRSLLAILILISIFINYLALFVPIPMSKKIPAVYAKELEKKKTGDKLEIMEMRNENSKTFLQKKPDGTNNMVLEAYLGSIHYKDDLKNQNEDWKEIDTNIVSSPDQSEYQFQNEKNLYKSYFKTNSQSENLVKYQFNNKSISYTLKDNELGNLHKVTGYPQDYLFTYPKAYDGVDVRFSVGPEKLVEEFVFNEYLPVDKISQEISFDGVYFEKGDDGEYRFFDENTHEKLWTIPKPVIYETNNLDNRSYGIHYEISCLSNSATGSCNRMTLSKVVDEEGKMWLKDVSRQYPLVIDAVLELTVGAGSDDVTLEGSYRDTSTSIMFGGVNGYAANYGQGYRFTNVTIAQGSTVTSAYLSLVNEGDGWIAVDTRLTAINEDNTATFSSGSPPGSRAITSSYIADETPNVNWVRGTRYNFPPTGAIQATLGSAINVVINRAGWASGNALAVVNQSDQDASADVSYARETFRSYDYGTPATNAPKLNITYTENAIPENIIWLLPLILFLPRLFKKKYSLLNKDDHISYIKKSKMKKK